MNQVAQPVSAGRWIGRVIVGVLVAEGVWGLIVSLTRDLIMPYLAQRMGGVSQPAQNTGNINVPGIFAAVIALCLAGLVAVILNFWVSRPMRPAPAKRVAAATSVAGTASASLSIAPPARPAPAVSTAPPPISAAPAQASAVQRVSVPGPVTPSKPSAPPAAPAAAAKPAPAPASAGISAKQAPLAPPVAPPPKPVKPKPPKEIQYNIVGEPISPMDEDE